MTVCNIKTAHRGIIITNVLATQTRQPPTRDSARTSYENQNQFDIKIDPKINPKVNLNLPYYINTL
jgi:hypothetical protein